VTNRKYSYNCIIWQSNKKASALNLYFASHWVTICYNRHLHTFADEPTSRKTGALFPVTKPEIVSAELLHVVSSAFVASHVWLCNHIFTTYRWPSQRQMTRTYTIDCQSTLMTLKLHQPVGKLILSELTLPKSLFPRISIGDGNNNT